MEIITLLGSPETGPLFEHFPAFCAEAAASKDKIFTFLQLKVDLQTQQKMFQKTKVKEWNLISIVCRPASCSSSSSNYVLLTPRAVKSFLPDRKLPPFSPRLKCHILFRAAAHPVRKLRLATMATKEQIKAWNWNTMEARISWKCLFKPRGHEAVRTVWRHCHLRVRFSALLIFRMPPLSLSF